MFISYQWDHQEEAIRVRQFLEEVTTPYHTIPDIWLKHILQTGRTILLDGHWSNGRRWRSLHSDLPGLDQDCRKCKSGKSLAIKDQVIGCLCLTLWSLRVFPPAAFFSAAFLQSRLSPTTAPRLDNLSWNITITRNLPTQEILLADLLKKPILPVMMAKTPWPPPGPLAMILAPLVYTDLGGAGGHGGQVYSCSSTHFLQCGNNKRTILCFIIVEKRQWKYDHQGKHADWLQKMTALLLKLEPLVVTERWEAHKVGTMCLQKILKYKSARQQTFLTLVVTNGRSQFFMKLECKVWTVQADTTILEECVEAVAVGVGHISIIQFICFKEGFWTRLINVVSHNEELLNYWKLLKVGNSALDIPLDPLGPSGHTPSLPSLPHSALPSQVKMRTSLINDGRWMHMFFQSVATGLEETGRRAGILRLCECPGVMAVCVIL